MKCKWKHFQMRQLDNHLNQVHKITNSYKTVAVLASHSTSFQPTKAKAAHALPKFPLHSVRWTSRQKFFCTVHFFKHFASKTLSQCFSWAILSTQCPFISTMRCAAWFSAYLTLEQNPQRSGERSLAAAGTSILQVIPGAIVRVVV